MILVTSKANPIWHFRRDTGGPRRIVHVPPRFASAAWSGTEATVLELAKEQLSTGMEPIIITTMTMSEIRHEVVSGIRVHRHPQSYLFFGSGEDGTPAEHGKDGNMLPVPIFQSLMQEPEVRLFHTHTLGRLGGEVLNAARMRFRPFVATVHQESGISPLSISRKELEDADMVIFTDKIEADRASATLGHDRIAHLPHGVDCARFGAGNGASFRANHGIPSEAFVIGSLSRPDTQKNLLLLEAFTQATARRPGVHLVLAAPDTQADDAARLNARIQEHNLGAQVHLLSTCEGQDRVDALHACDALVLLPWQGASSTDLFEIWSARRPVIANRFSAIGNLVREGETGLLFDPEASEAHGKLAEHIERLAADEVLRQHMSQQGHDEAQSRDWSRIGAQLEEIYKLAEKHHQSARQLGRRAA